MKKAIISARNLSIGYAKSSNSGGNKLYENLNFDLYNGELTCLLGSNGAGKSTLLRTMSAMQQPLDGSIVLEDKSLKEYSESELSHKIGLVLTDKMQAGGFRVYELVALGRYPYTGFFGRLTKHDKSIVEKAMEDVGIRHKADSYIAELSDGEKQKVMIAKSLAQECPIIFLDEPTAYLDIVSKIEIMDLLHRLAQTQQKTILLTTHDIEMALTLADRLWLLSRKYGLKCGVTEDLLFSDSLSLFLSRNNITFDKRNGAFSTIHQYDRSVFLKTSDETLYHWTKNFMKRNGWNVTDNSSEAELSLKVISPNSLKIDQVNDDITFPSFEEFGNWLQNNFPARPSKINSVI